MRYDDALNVREARQRYFAENRLVDGGYRARWVRLQAGPLALYFPNTRARVRALRFHDIHHLLTGYDTTWTGESEIAAWEIASGCARHYAAWLLNLSALAIGLTINPRAVFCAFVRGRRTANLYTAAFDDSLLSATVGSLRHRLRLGIAPGLPTLRDRVTFAVCAVLGVATLAGSILIALAAPIMVLALVLR